MTSIYDPIGLRKWASIRKIDPHLVRKMRNSFLKKFVGLQASVKFLPIFDHESISFHELVLVDRADSGQDGASKLLFKTASGDLLETVILRIATGRTTLCLSSQSGCAVGCSFCATGKMGLKRQLTSAQILDQVVFAGEILAKEGRIARNLVFMGMGEPLQNELALHGALTALLDPQQFAFSPNHILVSTSGIPEAMHRLADHFPKVGIALSLHAARQSVRQKLVPIGKMFSVDRLRQTVQELNQKQKRPVMIEYVMLKGENDGPEDLEALAEFCRDLRVHINLLPFNPIDADLNASSVETMIAWSRELKGRGFKATTRYSLGRDVAAACGQLVRDKEKT